VPVTIPARTIALFVGIALVGFVLLAGLYATRSILLQLVAAIVLAMAAEPGPPSGSASDSSWRRSSRSATSFCHRSSTRPRASSTTGRRSSTI